MILGSSSSPSTHFNLLQPRTSGSAGTPTDLRGISRTEKRSSVRNGPCFCNCVWTIFPIEQNLLYTQCSWFFDCCLMEFWWFFAFRYTKFQYFGVSSCAKTGAQVASVGPRYAWHTTWDDQRVRSGVWRASDHAPWRFYLGNFHGNVWQFQRVSRHQFLVMEIDGWPTINIWNNETMSFIHIYPSIWGTWYSIDSDGFKNIEHITSNNKRDMIELPVGKESWSKLCVYIYIYYNYTQENDGMNHHVGAWKFGGHSYQRLERYRWEILWLLCFQVEARIDKGVSENSVPLNPMVNDHYPY